MPEPKTFEFTSCFGIPFTARRVNTGDKYGQNWCLTHDGKPMIEFYDRRHLHTEFGQFVSRYNLDTLQGGERGHGLNLHGNVQDWRVDGESLAQVLEALV